MNESKLEREPCTWTDCVYYTDKNYLRCGNCDSDGHSCLTFKDDLIKAEEPIE